MTYDELEAQYFINLQKVKNLEASINDSLENILALEEENVRLELENSSTKNELRLKAAECDHALHNVINLKDQVRTLKLFKDKDSYPNDARWRQDKKVEYTDEYYPRYSTSLPMEQWAVKDDNVRHIVLKAVDTFGYGYFKNSNTYNDELHVYAKCGDIMIRYATNMSILEDRNIDAEEVIDDLLYGLKKLILKERY